jgi:hypothetical protein
VTDIIVDTKHLASFGKQLRVESPELEKEFHLELAAAGEIVAVKARQNAQSFPRQYGATTRIARSIRVKRRLTTVKVFAGGDEAPEAAPIEHGGLGGMFRHPLFGDKDHWYPQQAYPFLTPAADSSLPEVEAAVMVAVDSAIARMVL